MSLNLVVGNDRANPLPTVTAPIFLLGLNSCGMWVVRESTGRKAGIFRTRKAAIKYEGADGIFSIVDLPEGQEFQEQHLDRAA
jgi:hypothetical protein